MKNEIDRETSNTGTNNNCQYAPDFDCLRYYEREIERLWTTYGDWIEDDDFILLENDKGDFFWDYDDYFTALLNGYHYAVLDLGEFECLNEEDLFMNTWLVQGMELPNYIDYFWEAEVTVLCQNKDGDFYTIYQDGLSEHVDDQFSKYRCIQGDSGFYFCNKESCEDCSHGYTRKVVNPQYILWLKYVQPIELDE